MLPDVWKAIDDQEYALAEERLRADPDVLASRAGQMALGYLYAHTGRPEPARGVFRALREVHRHDPWEHIPLHQLARVERLAGQPEAALALLDEELSLIRALEDNAHELAVNALERAMSLRTLGHRGEARAALEECEGHAGPGDPETLGRAERERGELSLDEGHVQAARLHFERALAALHEAEDEPGQQLVAARLAALES